MGLLFLLFNVMRNSITPFSNTSTSKIFRKSSGSASITSFSNANQFRSDLCNLLRVFIACCGKGRSTFCKANIVRRSPMSAAFANLSSASCFVMKRPFSINNRWYLLCFFRFNSASSYLGLFRGGLCLCFMLFIVLCGLFYLLGSLVLLVLCYVYVMMCLLN